MGSYVGLRKSPIVLACMPNRTNCKIVSPAMYAWVTSGCRGLPAPRQTDQRVHQVEAVSLSSDQRAVSAGRSQGAGVVAAGPRRLLHRWQLHDVREWRARLRGSAGAALEQPDRRRHGPVAPPSGRGRVPAVSSAPRRSHRQVANACDTSCLSIRLPVRPSVRPPTCPITRAPFVCLAAWLLVIRDAGAACTVFPFDGRHARSRSAVGRSTLNPKP
jgi:hypothetical protein